MTITKEEEAIYSELIAVLYESIDGPPPVHGYLDAAAHAYEKGRKSTLDAMILMLKLKRGDFSQT